MARTKHRVGARTFRANSNVSWSNRRSSPELPYRWSRVEMTLTPTCCSWRRQYLQGAFGAPHPAHARQEPEGDVAPLLPVSIVTEGEASMPMREAVSENACEIEFDRARLRIRGNVSPDMLRLLIRELSRWSGCRRAPASGLRLALPTCAADFRDWRRRCRPRSRRVRWAATSSFSGGATHICATSCRAIPCAATPRPAYAPSDPCAAHSVRCGTSFGKGYGAWGPGHSGAGGPPSTSYPARPNKRLHVSKPEQTRRITTGAFIGASSPSV
jgi:hypothetical protein